MSDLKIGKKKIFIKEFNPFAFCLKGMIFNHYTIVSLKNNYAPLIIFFGFVIIRPHLMLQYVFFFFVFCFFGNPFFDSKLVITTD